MARRVAAVLVSAMVCLAGVGVGASAHSSGRAAVLEARERPVKTVTRSYGGRPVVVPRKHDLAVRFDGGRGDRVALGFIDAAGATYVPRPGDSEIVLRGPDGRVRPGNDGYYRLRDKGRHVFELRPVGRREIVVHLLVQKRVVHTGEKVQYLRQRRGYQYAVRLTVPESGLRVTTFANRVDRILAGGRLGLGFGSSLLLRPGDGVVGVDPFQALTRRLEAGDRVWVFLDPASKARVATTEPSPVFMAVDGGDVPLPADTPTAVSFEAAGGQLVRIYPRGLTPGWATVVIAPDGSRVKPTVLSFPNAAGQSANAGVYSLPATGPYLVVMLPGTSAESLVVDSVVPVPAVEVDGPARTLTVPADGRWLFAPITPTGAAYVEGSAATIPGDWTVFAGQLALPSCPPRGPLGCPDNRWTSITPDRLKAGPIWYGGHVVLIPLGGQTTGSVDVRLSSAPTA